jgi:plasmid stabilization system protein ParE
MENSIPKKYGAILYGHSRTVYLLAEQHQTIDILGKFHGSMDIETRLESD